uniref:Uncharacterized protein n=1 Tax=uncultured marine bacterium 443 TaxID=257393 RepID=Q6SGX6_9BACT|nr:hypothetical protein MBMO_EBAC000-65D02.38 [uncultured marine bacterium 443]
MVCFFNFEHVLQASLWVDDAWRAERFIDSIATSAK